jgi:hypothetical protein
VNPQLDSSDSKNGKGPAHDLNELTPKPDERNRFNDALVPGH